MRTKAQAAEIESAALSADLARARAERDRWRELALAYEDVVDDLAAGDVWGEDRRLRRIELARVGLVPARVGGSSL